MCLHAFDENMVCGLLLLAGIECSRIPSFKCNKYKLVLQSQGKPVKVVALLWHLKMMQWVNNFRRFVTGK